MERVIALVRSDKLRVRALECVRELDLPDCYIAAGFVRNLIWDHLHNKNKPTPLSDVDVIYFDLNSPNETQCQLYQSKLKKMEPSINWQVKNQALMHSRNNDKPYNSTLDAMRYWPEKQTAVAIRKLANGNFDCIAAFGFDVLFNLEITHNEKRLKSVFEHRIETKGWLKKWPKLVVSKD